MSHPHSQRASLHALQHDSVALLHTHVHKPRLEPSALVLQEAWLLLLLDALPGHKIQLGHQLTSVANAKRERVWTSVELLELLLQLLVKQDRRCPSASTLQHICITEPSNEHHSPELIERHAAVQQVTHMHIPRLESSCEHRRSHLTVSIRSLLTNDRHLVLACFRHPACRSLTWGVGEFPTRRMTLLQSLLLLSHALRIALQLLQLEGGRFPEVSQHSHRIVQHCFSIELHTYTISIHRTTDHLHRDIRFLVHSHHMLHLLLRHFHHQSQLLIEQHVHQIRLTVEVKRYSAITTKRHLQHCGNQTTI